MPAVRKGREDRGASVSGSRGQAPSSAILDSAFRKAYRATPHGATRLDRSRLRAKLKIVRSGAVVVRHLQGALLPVTRPPPTEFSKRLIDQRFGTGRLDRAIVRVRRAQERIRGLVRDEQRSLRTASGTENIAEVVREMYGRLASFVREVDPDLALLREIKSFQRDRPSVNPELPTVVVAGFPNVGKSSLVAELSTATPKVAEYPFTTLAVSVGHADLGFDRLQVMDTPGVLGRSGRHNPAETEAETAVGVAATIVLFVIDPTGQSGYTIEEQERLLERWRREFPKLPFLEVETKSDLPGGVRSASRLQVSSKTKSGLEELRTRLGELVSEAHVNPAGTPAPVDEWPEWGAEPSDR